MNKFDQESKVKAKPHKLEIINEDELEVDKFDNPDEQTLSATIKAPTCFKGELKHY